MIGESTETWAINQPGLAGSIKILTHCARCGEGLPAKPHNEPRWMFAGPVMHTICDDCYDALPEAPQ